MTAESQEKMSAEIYLCGRTIGQTYILNLGVLGEMKEMDILKKKMMIVLSNEACFQQLFATYECKNDVRT